VIQLPSGASLERTDAVTREVAAKILPIQGLRGAVMFAGFHGPSQTSAPNSAAIYFPFKTFDERKKLGATYKGIMDQAQKAVAGYDKARIILVPPRSFRASVPPAVTASCFRTARAVAMTRSTSRPGR
jgi:multidrug efflux pump subunit AcrB